MSEDSCKRPHCKSCEDDRAEAAALKRAESDIASYESEIADLRQRLTDAEREYIRLRQQLDEVRAERDEWKNNFDRADERLQKVLASARNEADFRSQAHVAHILGELDDARQQLATTAASEARLREALEGLAEPATRHDYTMAELDRAVCELATEALSLPPSDAANAVQGLVEVSGDVKEYRDACVRGESRQLSTFELVLYDRVIAALAAYRRVFGGDQ